MPGVYCLTQDIGLLMADGAAINIQVNNVTLDLNGYKLGNLGAGSGTRAFAVVGAQRRNITVKNGTIRGFAWGVFFNDTSPFTATSGHRVEDVRFDRITSYAVYIAGQANVVRNCHIIDTGGSTAFGPDTAGVGVYVLGPGNRVLDNDIMTVLRQGAASGAGVLLVGATDALVVGNRITRADVGVSFADSTGKFRDNLTNGVTLPFAGGTDAGNNN